MYTLPRSILVAALVTLVSTPATAQGTWVGHADDCDISTGHFLVGGAVLYLKQAVETRFPDEREGRLQEAHRVLIRAVTEGGQADNAGAWYYLGRYYVLTNDPAGADSAFRRAVDLEPTCENDVATYRDRIAPVVLNEALRTWGEGHPDSAIGYFSLARGLAPDDAEAPLYMGMMYSQTGNLDSAAKYVAIGVELARVDTAHADRRKQAQLELARAFETRAYQNPAVTRAPQSRQGRDSVADLVAQDSSRLATMVGRVQEIRAAGRQLDEQSRSAFERESTTVATELAGRRAARDSLATQAAADSAAAVEAVRPAIEQFEGYLEDFPDDVDAAMSLVRLHSAAGNRARLNAVIERITSSGQVDPGALVQGGMTLAGEGQHEAAVRMLETALEANPYDRSALMSVCSSYYALRDGDKLLAAARRLMAGDPLNSNTMRMVARAWVLAGNRDSVDHYVKLADGEIGWHVNVQQFIVRESVTRLNGTVRNLAGRPLPATTLVFEFLDSDGNVVFSSPVELPAMDPRGRERVSIREEQGGVVAWRYRQQ